MAKLTLNNILSGFLSAVGYNTNNTLIETALENTLSRDGTGPNQMAANLDMDSNRIINLPEPVNSAEAARLADVQAALAGGAAYIITANPTTNNPGLTVQEHLDNLGSTTGGLNVGYTPSGVGAVATTVHNKLRETVSILDFGAVADGVTDDSVAVTAAEASAFSYIDLLEKTVYTTIDTSTITKNYFNGNLITQESGNPIWIKPSSPYLDSEIQRDRTKSPLIDWSSKNVLWLGTSIPHQGGSVDSYPTLFGLSMGCTVVNKAWSGSKALYDVNADPFDTNTIDRLSMTEDDRLAGLALYGATSAYDDSFNPITKASSMTCDARIRDQFASAAFDCVMLDHNHNDRLSVSGTLTPPTYTITGITKGVTTTFTAPSHTFAVGDAVALEVVGIASLNHAAARVQTVAGDDITINIDSSLYAGAFTSGDAIKLDRNTVFGAFEFLIHYILNCSIIYGSGDCKIVLSGSPNEYTASRTRPDEVYFNATQLKLIANKMGVAFFDIGQFYDIKYDEVTTYFTDGTHPTTTVQRQALANYWAHWASGGMGKVTNELAFLPSSADINYTEQREALYSKYSGGFGTQHFITGATTNLITEDFVGIGDWTAAGTGAAPTNPIAPWGVDSAAYFDTNNTTSYLYRAATCTNATTVEFDLWVPTVSGIVASGITETAAIFKLDSASPPAGIYNFGIQFIIKSGSVEARVSYSTDGVAFSYIPIGSFLAATKYNLKLELIQGTATYNGTILVYLDNVLVGARYNVDFTAFLSLPVVTSIGMHSLVNAPFQFYIGNFVLDSLAITDYSTRGTDTLHTEGGKTVSIVNGIVTSSVQSASGIQSVTTATDTVLSTSTDVTCNFAGTVTLTLPSAATYAGKVLWVRTITANAVVSATANVNPRIGGAAGTAILPATDGAWGRLISNGSTWEIVASS